MKTLLKIMVAAIVAMAAGIVVLAVTDNERAFFCTLFGVAALCAMALGTFDERSKARFGSIRHKTGRSYGQAAIFVGAACVFIGTPQQCEDMADDLLHYGQQAEVRALTGEETLEVL